LLFGSVALAQAAELVMFEAKGCPYCARWNAEIGHLYAKTDEGKRLALRRVDVDEPRPPDLKEIAGIRFTPTFVVVDGGREVGRIVGYLGEDQFWGLLGQLVERLNGK
jgi:thioredoxin-related protein